MNTVDALKKLYKTLAGKDYAGDPNPTDAEMIDAIAKDAQSGGGEGSFTPRIIDMFSSIAEGGSGTLEYEPGLGVEDFIGALVKVPLPGPDFATDQTSMAPAWMQIIGVVDFGTSIYLVIWGLSGESGTITFQYNPETGIIASQS